MAYMRLGDLLVSSGIITGEQLEQALALPREDGQRLGDVLIRQGVISEAQLIDALRVQLGVDFVDLTAVSIPVELAKYVPRNLAKKFLVVPVKLVQDRLYLAMHDPLDFVAQDEVKTASRKRIIPMIATRKAVEQAIERLYGSEGTARVIEEMKREAGAGEDIIPAQMARDTADPEASAPTILGFLFLFGLFFLMGDQSDWERIYSCKTDKTAFWGYLIPQSITLLLLLLPAFTGVLLRTLTNDVSDGYVLYWFVSQMISPQMTIFVILVIISSVLSSADSFMVASGVMFSGDIFHRFINPEAGDRELIFWTRVVAILAGSIGYAFAINMLDIMQLWSVGIGIAAVILLPAYFSAWFSRRVNTQGALAGMGTGIVYCASLVLTDASFSVGRVLLGFGLNVLATVVISLSTPPPAPEHVARTYYWAPHFHQTENPPDPSGQS